MEMTIDSNKFLLEMKVKKEIAEYIKKKIGERERSLYLAGKIDSRSLTVTELAKRIGASRKWVSNLLNADPRGNVGDDFLIKISNFLEIDEHELFKVARRVHPSVLEEVKKRYLAEFYEEGL